MAINEKAVPVRDLVSPPPGVNGAVKHEERPDVGEGKQFDRGEWGNASQSSRMEPAIAFRRQELDAEFSKRRPLQNWLIMSALCLTLAAVISGRSMLSTIWTDRSGVAPCIAGIFVIAFGKSFFDVLYLDEEFRKTDEQVRTLWATNNVKSFLDRAGPGIFRHHVSNLVSIFKRDDHIDQDNLIELVHMRIKSRIRPLDVAANVMVSLGLVGTIVGLIKSVGGLGGAMANAGTNENGLLAGMNETLGGMGTAFTSTLLGAIFGGVILRLVYTAVNSQSDYLVAHIAEVSEVYILPVLRDAASERRAAAAAAKVAMAKKSAAEMGACEVCGMQATELTAAAYAERLICGACQSQAKRNQAGIGLGITSAKST